MTNIDYKQLGISDEANEFFEIYHEYLHFSKKFKTVIGAKYDFVNNVYCELPTNCDWDGIKRIFDDVDELEGSLRDLARVIWNYETKTFF